MFVAVDCASKFAPVELHDKSTRDIATLLLAYLNEKVPFAIHTILSDKGIEFADPRQPTVLPTQIKSAIRKFLLQFLYAVSFLNCESSVS